MMTMPCSRSSCLHRHAVPLLIARRRRVRVRYTVDNGDLVVFQIRTSRVCLYRVSSKDSCNARTKNVRGTDHMTL